MVCTVETNAIITYRNDQQPRNQMLYNQLNAYICKNVHIIRNKRKIHRTRNQMLSHLEQNDGGELCACYY